MAVIAVYTDSVSCPSSRRGSCSLGDGGGTSEVGDLEAIVDDLPTVDDFGIVVFLPFGRLADRFGMEYDFCWKVIIV